MREAELVTHPSILVIEDDVDAALEDEGLQPAIAASGEEAVTLLKSDRSDYRALVVDAGLPGWVDGWEVARAARRIDPTFPVVYIAAAATGCRETQGVPESVLLKKPFAPADPVTGIQQLLEKGSGVGPQNQTSMRRGNDGGLGVHSLSDVTHLHDEIRQPHGLHVGAWIARRLSREQMLPDQGNRRW